MGVEDKIDPLLRYGFLRHADLIDTTIICDSTQFCFGKFYTAYQRAADEEARERIIALRTHHLRRAMRGPLEYLRREGVAYLTPEGVAAPEAHYAVGAIMAPLTRAQARAIAALPAVRCLLRTNEEL